MPKTTASKSKKRQPTRKKNNKQQVTWQQVVVIAVAVIAITVGIVFSVLHGHSGGLGARDTADAFIQALTDCDAAAIEKYAPLIAANEEKMTTFRQTCKPGVITATFVREAVASPSELQGGEGDHAATYTYKIHDESQPTYKDANLIVQVVKPSDTDPWQVLLIGGVPIFR